MDEPKPVHNIAMTAILDKANAKASRRGAKSYRIAFSYPRGFLGALDEILGMTADLYWNDDLIANGAHIISMRQQASADEDPNYVIELDLDPDDTALANLADEVRKTGTLRFQVTQLALFGNDVR